MKSLMSSLILAAVLMPGSIVYAGKQEAATPRPSPRRTVIKSISSKQISVDTGVFTKDFKLNERTIYTYQGQRVAQSDLKPGMRVTVTPSFDNLVAALVAASDAPNSAPSPVQKK